LNRKTFLFITFLTLLGIFLNLASLDSLHSESKQIGMLFLSPETSIALQVSLLANIVTFFVIFLLALQEMQRRYEEI